MVQVKICGITNAEDALCAAACGAAALGFIFYPSSVRYIAPVQAREIINKLPADIVRVGVFVNEVADTVARIAELCRLDFIQLHGDESTQYCSGFAPETIIKAVELSCENDLSLAAKYNVAAILTDSRAPGLYGGTGKKSNWDLALKIKREKPLILSGGLNESNVVSALETVAPQALDINSGVEIKPGKKDHRKMERIFDIVRGVPVCEKEREIIFRKKGR